MEEEKSSLLKVGELISVDKRIAEARVAIEDEKSGITIFKDDP